jgi:hypothetical protein
MPTATRTPTPTITPLPTETPPPTPTPPFTPTAPAPASAGGLQGACAVPVAADLVTVTLAAESPVEAVEAWAQAAAHEFRAAVSVHDPVGKAFVLRAVDPAMEQDLVLAYTGDPPALDVDREYRFVYWADPPGTVPSGRGLRIDDDTGPLFLSVSLRETDGAARRVLDGDRAGFALRQLSTPCVEGIVHPCGYQLRAAPLEVALQDASLTLDAGTQDLLESTPPYTVSVSTSHIRLPVAAAQCADPTDWVLSMRLQRAP